MGHSAKIKWRITDCYSSYYIYGESPIGKLNDDIYISNKHIKKLGIFIHEINECELTHLFIKMGIEQVPENIREYKINKKFIEKYQNKFPDVSFCRGKIMITHMLSPYGRYNCIMDSNKNRVDW